MAAKGCRPLHYTPMTACLPRILGGRPEPVGFYTRFTAQIADIERLFVCDLCAATSSLHDTGYVKSVTEVPFARHTLHLRLLVFGPTSDFSREARWSIKKNKRCRYGSARGTFGTTSGPRSAPGGGARTTFALQSNQP